MAQQTINIGSAPDDGTGDTLRVGGDKINDNFTELYTDKADKAGGTFTGDIIVPDEAYDATAWNGSLEVPTKNAVRDKIESLGSSGLTVEDEGSSEGTGITTLNFTGSGASVTVVGSEAEIIIPGGISTFALGDATDVDTTGQATGNVLIYNGTNWVPIARHRGCLVALPSDAASTNYTAGVAVAFGASSEVYDTDSIHDTVTNNTRLTVPSGVSKVRLKGQIGHSTTGTSGSFDLIRIQKNGAFAYAGMPHQIVEITGTIGRVQISTAVLPVSPGDYFELIYLSESDTSIVLGANETWFEMEIIE